VTSISPCHRREAPHRVHRQESRPNRLQVGQNLGSALRATGATYKCPVLSSCRYPTTNRHRTIQNKARAEVRGCFEIRRGPVFAEKAGWRRAREGASPRRAVTDRETKPDSIFREDPPGGGSFGRGRRWLGPYSPLRGCPGLAALASAKTPRRRPPGQFQNTL